MNKPPHLHEDTSAQYVKNVLEINPNQVQQYKNGATGLMGFFMAKVMIACKGSCNPGRVKEELELQLSDK